MLRCLVLACAATLAACPSVPPDPVEEEGGDVPPPERCLPPSRGELPIDLEPVFHTLSFSVPVDVVTAPNAPDRMYVVEATGTVRVVDVDPDAEAAPVFLDVTHHLTHYTGEIGLWDIAFHPRYPDEPYVFAFLSGTGGSTDFRSLLVRFTTRDLGLTIDPTSEEVLMSIERAFGAGHQGGKLGFSKDGLLWISTGDGDGYGDPLGRAQDRYSLLGKMLRIDVDGGTPYAIPPSNPFALGGGAPEVYALGFRNPWRWSFDRETDDVWVADVGHERLEEIDRVVRGGNYGWPKREGSSCWAEDPCPGDFVAPVYEYGRDQGSSVTGGYVYRGQRFAELAGGYVFGDYTSGRIWILRDDGAHLLAETGLAIAAFAEEPDGELLVAEAVGGKLYRISPSTSRGPAVPAPFLRATGCLDDPRLVEYDVNAPLWSDGLDKQRHVGLPHGTLAAVQIDGRWELPNNTVLVKTFSYGGNPVETRLLVRDQDGEWMGWSYAWFGDGFDALRVDDGRVIEIEDRSWYLPSSAECLRCHSPAAGYSLGLHQAQLDRGAQLDELHARGLFDGTRASVPPLVPLESNASLERRARSYLHTNCSMCHRPGGPAQGNLDLRDGVPLAQTHACDQDPRFGTLGIPDARIIAAGAPERSVLTARMAQRGDDQMPPLATLFADDVAVEIVAAWIASLTSCE